MKTERTLVVVVTGLSGAGKSTAVHALEDLGFFCVDNLPSPVVATTLDACAAGGVRKIALGIDIRVRKFLDDAAGVLDTIAGPDRDLSVLFLDATDETLLRRFSSTRRPHPLSTSTDPGEQVVASALLDGVRTERRLLAALRARSNVILDTTRLSVHDLRRRIVAHYGPGTGQVPRMRTRIVSFGFKYGAPVDADIVLDARFLQNPYFVEELSPLPGTDPKVRDFVLGDDEAVQFTERSIALLEFCLPRFEREGKSYATVALGCTGGRHRSVVLAERMRSELRGRLDTEIEVVHRDLERHGSEGGEAAVPSGGTSK